MQFFLYEVVARAIAIYLCVDSCRELWGGFFERKLRAFNGDLLDWSSWSRRVVDRDSAPVGYWIQIGIRIFMLLACLLVAIFGWRPHT